MIYTPADAARLDRAAELYAQQCATVERVYVPSWYHCWSCPVCGGTLYESGTHAVHCVEDGCDYEEQL